MIREFISFDELLSSIEVELVNILFDYKLLDKFSLDAKKILLYFLVRDINDRLHNKKMLIYHTHSISDDHEILKYYPKDKLDVFFNKLCSKIKKITNRLFFITSKRKIPSKSQIDQLEGEVIDEVILLDNTIEPDLKKLRDFLHKHNLKDLFDSLTTVI